MYQSNFRSSSATVSSINSSGGANGTSASSSGASAAGDGTGLVTRGSAGGACSVISWAALTASCGGGGGAPGTETGAASAGAGGIIPSGGGSCGVTLSGSLITVTNPSTKLPAQAPFYTTTTPIAFSNTFRMMS